MKFSIEIRREDKTQVFYLMAFFESGVTISIMKIDRIIFIGECNKLGF